MDVITTFTAIRGTLDALKTAVEIRDYTKAAEAQLPLLNQVLDLYQEAMKLSESNATLKKEVLRLQEEIGRMKDLKAEMNADYERYMTPGGATVYRPKDPSKQFEYLCANCMSDGKKTFLQPTILGSVRNCPVHGTIKC